MDKAIENNGLTRLDWGSGIWQRVSALQNLRKGYVHRFISENEYFPDKSVADAAIENVREAVIAIFQHASRPLPLWVYDDDHRGWDPGRRGGPTLTLIHSGANENDPKVIKLYFFHQDKENLTDVLPIGTDYLPYVEDLILKLRVPASAIKVCEGDTVVYEKELNMR